MDHSDYPQSDSSENIPSNNIPSNYPQSNETPPSNNQIYTNHPIPQRTIGKFVEIHGKSIQEYVLARQEPGPTDDERDIFNRSKYRKYFINYNNYDKKILKENDCYILMESDQISDNISSRKSFIMRRADQSPVPTNEKKLKDEIAKIASIDSNTIARFRGFSLYDPDGNKMPTLITDRPKNGPLYNYVINTSHPLQDHQIYTIILGIASGLEKLHTIGIVHGHLNLTNIYLDEHMHPYICDYGFIDSNSSRGIPERDLYFTNVAYYAPEVINKWEFSPAADVFSLGMIMFSLFANSLPYPGIYANTLLYERFTKWSPKKFVGPSHKPLSYH